MFVIVLFVYCTVCVVCMFAPVGKNGFANYCEGKNQIYNTIMLLIVDFNS